MTVRLRRLDGGETAVTDERIDALRAAFHGPLITPDDSGYDESRVVHNAMFDRHPGLIARCSGAADVIDAVILARERDLLVAVRGGGHGIAGHCTYDEA